MPLQLANCHSLDAILLRMAIITDIVCSLHGSIGLVVKHEIALPVCTV